MEPLKSAFAQQNTFDPREPQWVLWLVLALTVLSALPCVVFRYLPMTDLPQHEAIVSIMRHMGDPAFGFERYYDWALDRTLYVFPYFLALGLSFVVNVRLALHITIFLAAISYPIGILLTLRALRRPVWLALLALPLMYNRSFFWGFINFNLGIGIAFIVLSQLVGNWTSRKGWIVAGLCLLSAVTHVYGLLLLVAYAFAWLISGQRRRLVARAVWMIPALLALGCWGLFAAKAPGYGVTEWAPFDVRLKEIGHSILGGYTDSSEDVILVGIVAIVFMLSWNGFPITWKRWLKLGVHGRASYLVLVANVVAYFLMPVATPTAKFIHFRHAVIATMMLPLIVAGVDAGRFRRLAASVAAAPALLALAGTWWHFGRFEREASGFDSILAAIPARAHMAQLTYEAKGAILRSHAYLHFGAYAQAEKGGVVAVSFPILFWNIPLKGRANSDMPDTPKNLEWAPGRYNEYRMGAFYDTILVRQKAGFPVRPFLSRPYDLAAAAGPWKLYRRAESH